MKTKIFIFFALVSVFRLFADCESDKQQLLDWTYDINGPVSNLRDEALTVSRIAGNLSNGTLASSANRIAEAAQSISTYNNMIRGYAKTIDCSNDTCSVDLGPLSTVVSNIYDVIVSEYSVLSNCSIHLSSISEDTDVIRLIEGDIFNRLDGVTTLIPGGGGYLNVFDSRLLSALASYTNQFASFNVDVMYDFGVVTNSINDLYRLLGGDVWFSSGNLTIYEIVSNMGDYIRSINSKLLEIYYFVYDLSRNVSEYLPYLAYLENISQDISYLATNDYFNVNVSNLSNYFQIVSSHVGVSTYPFQRMAANLSVSRSQPTAPYNSSSALRNSNIAETIQGGFINLLQSSTSLNNYFYWLMNYLATNKTDYSEITTGLANLTNILNRVDDYVLGDFSNQFYHVFECIDILVSNSLDKVDYTTNLVEITQQLYTNNNHLVSIDSKLDVLGYIKVLSDTPLSQFSGDSYYDYLTNLYLTGGSSSSVSTNWFERIEILLASLVFGDSVSSNISTEVEFSNFSEDKVRDAFNDYTFQNELNSGIDLVENTGENFLTILRGFHNALASVSQPQSIAIGIGGIDGGDTLSFEDAQHGHFQVSFGSGASDNFTLIVRSMTTIIWILFTMMFIYFSARWLLFKVLFFYRLMRTLITSLFLK